MRIRLPGGGRWMAWAGLALLAVILVVTLVGLPFSFSRYDAQDITQGYGPPSMDAPFGRDKLGRSLWWRCVMGGGISLAVGIGAAVLSVTIGVTWGAVSGYFGGRIDAMMMRIVDVLYGLPYVLLVVLVNIALQPAMEHLLESVVDDQWSKSIAGVLALFIAIGGVSWLTISRVIRGQVLSLRAQPFIESAKACGVGPARIVRVHILPNLVGPIVVYTTLTVPVAVLQESFLSFLGIGVQPPLPSWGALAADGVSQLHKYGGGYGRMYWWLLFWPCLLLGLTLLSLNLVGDGLRNRLDPRMRGVT